MSAGRDPGDDIVEDPQPESALLVAARQLSEEAWLRPQLAGLSIARQRAVANQARRLARRMTMPTA
ncbi:MAG: hypothetical protein M3313_14195 [Actinomycetota bacterium]|nr:hypothetical protein [Actinomycetota bacterium]